MLYTRFVVIVVIGLITSRLVLKALGVTDYGVYSVVGSVVALLSFFGDSLMSSTQRFLNVAMEDPSNGSVKKIFSTAVNLHFIIAIGVVALLETAGLWYILNKLVVPPGQLPAAIFVFQCSVINCFFSIINSPYLALIMAHERMGVYAYISIAQWALHLGLVGILLIIPGIKLEIYGVLMVIEMVFVFTVTASYTRRKFPESKYMFTWDKPLVKKLLSFSGWMVFGSASDILSAQGVNMLLNMFFGPVLNASRTVAVQIQTGISVFSQNFMLAVYPHLVKSYTRKDYDYTNKLSYATSKMSFFLMLVLGLPIILNAYSILRIWLDIVPEYSAIFLQLLVLECMFRALFAPLEQLNKASGKVRIYQIASSALFILTFVGSYILFKIGCAAYSTFILSAAIAFVGLFVRLIIIKKIQNYPLGGYFRNVFGHIIPVVIISAIASWGIYLICSHNFWGTLASVLSTVAISALCIFLIGFNRQEKSMLKTQLSMTFHKLQH